MGKLQPKRFTLEDFQAQKDWIGPLFSSLNQFIQEVVTSFSNGITVEDNSYSEIKEFKITNSSTNYPVKFLTKFNVSPKGLVPIYVFNNTLGAPSAAAPWLEWGYGNGEITISAISGLTSGSTYTIRLLIIYG